VYFRVAAADGAVCRNRQALIAMRVKTAVMIAKNSGTM